MSTSKTCATCMTPRHEPSDCGNCAICVNFDNWTPMGADDHGIEPVDPPETYCPQKKYEDTRVVEAGDGIKAEDPATSIIDPSHYTRFTIQPMEFIVRNGLPGHVANIVKYSCRAGHKLYPDMTPEQSEIKDLEKAIRWCRARIRLLEGEATL